MKRPVIFSIAIAVAVLGVIIAVYFLIPGIYHPYIALNNGKFNLVDPNKHPYVVKSAHHLYALAFFFLAAMFALAAYLLRPKKMVRIA